MTLLTASIVIGVGATVLIDVWGVLRKRLLHVPAPNYGLVGRWLLGVAQGRLRLERTSNAAVSLHEQVVGWLSHYLIGIAFAALLLVSVSAEWLLQPTLVPALIVGISTVAAPFFLLQPGMGAGIAASRTPRPWSARLHSVITHAIFGVGLYLSAQIISQVY